VAAALALLWGVMPFVSAERNVERLKAELLERRLIDAGSVVVFVNVSADQDRTDANFLQVRKV
jgi:hypothetical protein